MANIPIDQLADAIQEELTIYHKDITKRVNKLSKETAQALVKKTRLTAPKDSGDFRKAIASKEVKKSQNGNTYAWYVKKPKYRITHLLVHGYAKADGGRVAGDPFLENALAEVLPEYEQQVEEAIRND